MNYFEFVFTITSEEDFHRDLLINALAEVGFDTFEETSAGFNAYVPETEFNQAVFDGALDCLDGMISFSYEKHFIPKKNWNEEWESNFEPLIIKGECYVRATFHKPQPQYPHEIIIDPKMSFGTGHHQTTTMMMEYILEEDFKDKSVLDMGCGTGILAILAEKLGAKNLVAIDYDPICFDSTIENIQLNQSNDIKALCGSKEVIPNRQFDIILANINRNILIDQIGRYSEALRPGAFLFMSGFYVEDLPHIEEKANQFNLTFVNNKTLDNWVAVKFMKQN